MKKHDDAKQDKSAMDKIASVKVREHERKMHQKAFAKGGAVRGIGAARAQKFKDC